MIERDLGIRPRLEIGDSGRLDEDSGLVSPFAVRQKLVRKDLYDELDARYGV